jgi:hypothetical protein
MDLKKHLKEYRTLDGQVKYHLDFQLGPLCELLFKEKRLQEYPRVAFLERFFDDEHSTLMKQNNWWLRERMLYRAVSEEKDTDIEPPEIVLSCFESNNSFTKRKTIPDVKEILGENFPTQFDRVIASYAVFRYQIDNHFFIDQVIYDFSHPSNRFEVCSLHFSSLEDFESFLHNHCTWEQQRMKPSESKLMIFLKRDEEKPSFYLPPPVDFEDFVDLGNDFQE